MKRATPTTISENTHQGITYTIEKTNAPGLAYRVSITNDTRGVSFLFATLEAAQGYITAVSQGAIKY